MAKNKSSKGANKQQNNNTMSNMNNMNNNTGATSMDDQNMTSKKGNAAKNKASGNAQDYR